MKPIKQIILTVLSVFIISCYLTALLSIFFEHSGVVWRDYISFQTAGWILREGKGVELYSLETQGIFQKIASLPYERTFFLPFRNTPVVGLFFIPFTYLGITRGLALYTIINISLLILITYEFWHMFPKLSFFQKITPLLYFPTFATIYKGQLNIFLLFIFLLLYKTINLKKDFWTGFLGGILFIKPQLLLILPFLFLLSKNKLRLVIGFFSSLCFLLLISVSISGINWIKDYFSFLSTTETANYGSDIKYSYAFYAFSLWLTNSLSLNSYWAILLNLLLYFYTLILFAKKVKDKIENKSLLFSGSLLLTLFFSIHTLSHDLSVLIFPIFLVSNSTLKNRSYIFYKHLMIFLMVIIPFLSINRFQNLYAVILAMIGYTLLFNNSFLIQNEKL